MPFSRLYGFDSRACGFIPGGMTIGFAATSAAILGSIDPPVDAAVTPTGSVQSMRSNVGK